MEKTGRKQDGNGNFFKLHHFYVSLQFSRQLVTEYLNAVVCNINVIFPLPDFSVTFYTLQSSTCAFFQDVFLNVFLILLKVIALERTGIFRYRLLLPVFVGKNFSSVLILEEHTIEGLLLEARLLTSNELFIAHWAFAIVLCMLLNAFAAKNLLTLLTNFHVFHD